MLISKKMNAAVNQQIENEFGASLQYVAIAPNFASEGLTALAGHFYKERDHAIHVEQYFTRLEAKTANMEKEAGE